MYPSLVLTALAALCGALLACSDGAGVGVGAAPVAARPIAASVKKAAPVADRPQSNSDSDASRLRLAAPGRAPFLRSPFGSLPVQADDSQPADPAHRTRAGLYLTRAEARQLDAEAGGETVWIEVECCGAAGVHQAYGIVIGIIAASDLADDVPVFVGGADLRQAKQLVDRLSDQGMTRPYLLTR